jgi:nucleotide-binding universal stress UspA family protein
MKTLSNIAPVKLNNILFTTDFSPAAEAALPYAAELARRFNAHIFALHVRPPTVNPLTQPQTWPILEAQAREAAEAEREKLASAFPGLKPTVTITEGDLWSVIAEEIEKNEIDLVVLGTHGRTGVKKFFLGSAAEEIFRQAPCPVLTVGPYTNGLPPRGGLITNIVYATDLRPESEETAKWALALAEEHQARLTLLHVVTEPKVGDFVGMPQVEEGAMRQLRTLVPVEAELWCKPRFVVRQGDPAKMILEVAGEQHADLIVLGLHSVKGVPMGATHMPTAVAHKVVSHAECPVLTVRG